MAKFLIGVIVGISLGASATAYGAGTARPGKLSGWMVVDADVEVCFDPNATEARGHQNGPHSWRTNLSR